MHELRIDVSISARGAAPPLQLAGTGLEQWTRGIAGSGDES
jgi:hypothetical protein